MLIGRLLRTRFSIVICCLLAAYTQSDQNKPVSWEQVDLYGKVLELIDDQKVEVYEFHDKVVVSATLGQKDGPQAAPSLFWRIQDNALVISEAPAGEAFEAFQLLTVDTGRLALRRKSGDRANFKLDTRLHRHSLIRHHPAKHAHLR